MSGGEKKYIFTPISLWKVELTTNVQDSTGSTSQLIVSAEFIFKKIKLAETWQY